MHRRATGLHFARWTGVIGLLKVDRFCSEIVCRLDLVKFFYLAKNLLTPR